MIDSDVYVDLFEIDSIEKGIIQISNIFDLDYSLVKSVFDKTRSDKDDVFDFLRETNLDLNKKFYTNAFIKCQHGTTTIDDFKCLEERGLLNLKDMLETDTPLRRFLKENSIEISVEKRLITIDNVEYNILNSSETCEKCIHDKFQCRDIFDNHEPEKKGCIYRRKMSSFEIKINHDKCETEVFLSTTSDSMKSYSTIYHCPEILKTLDDYIRHINPKNLCDKWKNIDGKKFCILEFYTNVKNLEFTYPSSEDDLEKNHMDIMDFYDYSVQDIYNHEVKGDLFINFYILKQLYTRLFSFNSEKYGQIKPETIISFDDITIIKTSI